MAKYQRISQLITDFIAICQSYARIIISELYQPEDFKVTPPRPSPVK